MAKPVEPDNAIGRVSRMDAIVNSNVAGAALREAERKLDNLQTMLKKVDDVDFGICSRCKHPIPFKRLMLMPQSSLCVNCAK
ncbi:MAG: TraR/DksA family transcriptional regulator [Saprospiraceae bacterium]|nr:MAG: TraR/DksA family transcriptional regulator [Saprospiraceae bacterium]